MCLTRRSRPAPAAPPPRLQPSRPLSRPLAPALAPELVSRILELAVGGDITHSERNAFLARACRVCRSWRLQGQRLLIKQVLIAGINWDRTRLSGLLASLEGGAGVDHLAFDMLGLPYAFKALRTAASVRHVEMMGSDLVLDSYESSGLSERYGHAQRRFLAFVGRSRPDLNDLCVTSAWIGSAWWHYPQVSGWVAALLRGSARTLQDLTVDLKRPDPQLSHYHPPRQCPTTVLLSTLSSIHLPLASLRVAHCEPAAADRVFAACPYARRLEYACTLDNLLALALGLSTQPLEGLARMDARLHELHIDAPLGLTKAGAGLRAALDAPAAARLEALVSTGRWAKTFVLMRDWRELAAKARERGVAVRLYDTGPQGKGEPEEVAVVVP